MLCPYASVAMVAAAAFGSRKLQCEATAKQATLAFDVRGRFASHQYPANSQIEDRVSTAQLGKFMFFSVLDGHGGWQVAERLRTSLPEHVRNHLNQTHSPEEVMKLAFADADDELKQAIGSAYSLGFSKLAKVGACCLAVLVGPESLTVSNAGDCKGILCRKNQAIPLNRQLNANEIYEQENLRSAHPGEADVVRCKREWLEKKRTGIFGYEEVKRFSGCYVKGLLQPTRGFGDFYLKDERFATDYERGRSFVNLPHSFPYISSEPETATFSRTADDKFIVLATDGLWDELTDEEVVDLAEKAMKAGASAEEVAALLVEQALKKAAQAAQIRVEDLKRIPQGGSRRSIHDDISVLVVIL